MEGWLAGRRASSGTEFAKGAGAARCQQLHNPCKFFPLPRDSGTQSIICVASVGRDTVEPQTSPGKTKGGVTASCDGKSRSHGCHTHHGVLLYCTHSVEQIVVPAAGKAMMAVLPSTFDKSKGNFRITVGNRGRAPHRLMKNKEKGFFSTEKTTGTADRTARAQFRTWDRVRVISGSSKSRWGCHAAQSAQETHGDT